MVIRIAAKVAGKGRKRIVKYVRKEKTFTFPRIEDYPKYIHAQAVAQVLGKRKMFIKRISQKGGKDITSESYAISRKSPKGPIHRLVVFYKMPKRRWRK